MSSAAEQYGSLIKYTINSAQLADGEPLPAWLTFDSSTLHPCAA